MILKSLFVILGTLTLVLGVIGIFTPGIPTTPLLLLSGYLYSKGSKKLHKALLENNFLGRYITSYAKLGGMTLRAKLGAIGMMCVMISISTYFLIDNEILDIIVISLGVVGSIVVGFVVKTIKL